MSRVRWYHFFFLFALVDAGVIFISLDTHRRTLQSFGELVDLSGHIDARAKWLSRAQQVVMDLSAPGNDAFRMEDTSAARAAYGRTATQVAAILDEGRRAGWNVARLSDSVQRMTERAERIFAALERMHEKGKSAEEQRALLTEASQAMAEMDAEHRSSMQLIDALAAPTAGERDTLLLKHEADLNAQMAHERYFIAVVVSLLVGLLWIGRWMQRTERALEAQRQQIIEERRERLAAVGELCSSVAHGIRNPLASIRSSAQLALELGEFDEDTRLRLLDILSEGGRLGDRVSGLLELARVDACEFRDVSLSGVMEAAVAGLRPELARRAMRVKVESPGDEVQMLGDRRQLEQAMIELLSNAMEQGPGGGLIRVGCARGADDQGVVLSVEDEGPGVGADVRERVFDLFFTTKPQGTGIGLATVKRIARLHGGDVTVRRAASGGARFEMMLPAGGNRG